MKIRVQDGLPYISATITHKGQTLTLENVLLDTGSAGTIFSADKVVAAGLEYGTDDTVHRIRGVGGAEFVFTKHAESLAVGDLRLNNFEIEVGAMDYGFAIDGIIGIDFLSQVKAVIDLDRFEIRASQE
jgi:hypothetical protein